MRTTGSVMTTSDVVSSVTTSHSPVLRSGVACTQSHLGCTRHVRVRLRAVKHVWFSFCVNSSNKAQTHTHTHTHTHTQAHTHTHTHIHAPARVLPNIRNTRAVSTLHRRLIRWARQFSALEEREKVDQNAPLCKLHHGGVACNLVIAPLTARHTWWISARHASGSRVLGWLHAHSYNDAVAAAVCQCRDGTEIITPAVKHPLNAGRRGRLHRGHRLAAHKHRRKVAYATEVQPHPRVERRSRC